MDGAAQTTAPTLTFHVMTVDQRSTFVNTDETTDLPCAVQRLECMSDARHKKSPPDEDDEPVTELFKQQVEAALATNRAFNTQHELKSGMRGYRIKNHAELARAVGSDRNTIKNLLGGVRPGTKAKATGRSKYVRLIREALGIVQLIEVQVPTYSLGLVKRISALPKPAFEEMERKMSDLLR